MMKENKIKIIGSIVMVTVLSLILILIFSFTIYDKIQLKITKSNENSKTTESHEVVDYAKLYPFEEKVNENKNDTQSILDRYINKVNSKKNILKLRHLKICMDMKI